MERERDQARGLELNPSVALFPNSNTSSGSPLPPPSRGKEIGLEEDPNSNTEIEERCGICLLESAKSICGLIDGCRHHFCFVCIMQWAKTESRCPLCKQRFRSIRRPVVLGLFSTERLVKIPERDQVYHPLGVESTAINETHLDPHCTCCNSSANEAYLVSCALCDSVFHTTCVGLGVVIPEAELYCSDCETCIKEHSKVQLDHDDSRYVDQETREKIRLIRRGNDSISIRDLVADIRGEEMPNPPSNTQSTGRGGRRSLINREQMEQGIQALRDNWTRLQSGSVTFTNVLRPYQITEGMRQNNPAATISSVGIESSSRESRDVQKAWEMMNKARLDLAKEEARQNRPQTYRSSTIVRYPEPTTAHRHPPMNKPRPYGEGVSAHHFNHEVSHPGRGFGLVRNDGVHAPSGSNDQPCRQKGIMHGEPLGLSSRVLQMGPSLLGRGASSAIEKRKHTKIEDVKAGIQSLVKHSLSALPKDKKKLGKNGYKEVARVSTHSILAACGLEHNKALTRSFFRPFCNHNKNMSNLVPGSCQDCFTAFVRQVVESVFLEKK